MMQYIKYILRFLPTLLAASIIAYFSLLREFHSDWSIAHLPHIDKAVHFFMYMFLSVVFSLDLQRAAVRKINIVVLTTIISILYGGLIELLQELYFYPRTGEWLDWLADIIGTLAGLCFYLTAVKMYKNAK